MPELPTHREDHSEVISQNARMGLVLFIFYFLLYAAYLVVNVFSPNIMTQTTTLGLNYAVITGVCLIVVAFLMALIYMRVAKEAGGDQGG